MARTDCASRSGRGDHLGINESIETVCYPTASAMASSFDRELLYALGEALGQECQAEQVVQMSAGTNAEDNRNLGSGSDKMMEAMMLEMPLSAFGSYGVMDEARLKAMIEDLNRTEEE